MQKTKQGFIPILVLLLVVILAGSAFFLVKNKTISIGTPLTTVTPIPTPTTYYHASDYPPVPTIAPTPFPFIFEPKDKSGLVKQDFRIDYKDIFAEIPSTMQCLKTDEAGNLNNNLDYGTGDVQLQSIIKQLAAYKFTYKWREQKPDGSFVEKSNPSSIRKITYLSICKANTTYFLSFTSYGPDVSLGGGQGVPSHIAYTDPEGNLKIVEYPPNASSTITLPGNLSRSGAYFGCGGLYALTPNYIYFSCGSGDGPNSSGSLYQLDLKTGFTKEMLFYQSGYSNGEFIGTKMYNSSGTLYYTSP